MTLSIEEARRRVTAPGSPFEVEEREIRGIRMRVWKNTPASLRSILELSRLHGDRPFLVYEGERLSYEEHYRAAATLSRILVEDYGVEKGDRVAIAMRNFPEWAIVFWAAAVAGAVVVPLNAWWTGRELEFGLTDSGASVLFADQQRAERLTPHLDNLRLKEIIVARSSGVLPSPMRRLDEVLGTPDSEPLLPNVELEPEDEATIFYTSGTSGKPKGALGTHRNICGNVLNLGFAQAFGRLRSGETSDQESQAEPSGSLMSVPFFHATGCHSILVASMVAGSKLVLIRRWDPERALELIESERLARFGGVPAMVWQVLESPNFSKHDLSSVRGVAYGGAPAASELVARIRQAFPGVVLGNGYGLTETSSVATYNAASDYERKPDSVGLPVAICDLRVVDANEKDVPEGEVGELWIKGPHVVKGYWNKPEATAESFRDGWLRSGDLARIDDEGFVYIVDRLKDMLIRGGENIYCVEVEDALYSHPAVMDAAVIGLPHPSLGEEAGAIVQISPGATVSENDLQRHVAERLAVFKVPVRIELRGEPLPRNAAGKILKRQLRDEILGAPGG